MSPSPTTTSPVSGEVKRTMTLNLSEAEMAVVDALAAEHDLSKTAIIRQALRLYQYTNQRLKEGERLVWSGDAQRAAEFVGVGWPSPIPTKEPDHVRRG